MILEVAFAAAKSRFPFIPLFDSNLVAGVAQVYLSEDFCQVQTVEHFRDEREGKAILDDDTVETPIVDHQPEFTIWSLHEHDRGGSRGLRWPDEAIGKVLFDISFHCRNFRG